MSFLFSSFSIYSFYYFLKYSLCTTLSLSHSRSIGSARSRISSKRSMPKLRNEVSLMHGSWICVSRRICSPSHDRSRSRVIMRRVWQDDSHERRFHHSLMMSPHSSLSSSASRRRSIFSDLSRNLTLPERRSEKHDSHGSRVFI